MPSVSVGDVAEVNGRYFLCAMVGWREIYSDELESYETMDRAKRILSTFK
jgi:hypothetical protein